MAEFNHILVPFDNSAASRNALDCALTLGGFFNSKISTVFVESNKTEGKAEEVVGAIEEYKTKSGKDIMLLRPSGKVYKEIVRAAEDIQADSIVMGNHGSSNRDMFFIGSNAYRVVSSANVPVLTLQEGGGQKFKKIVVPIDQSKETRQKIPMVSELAKKFGSKVHLFGTSKYDDDESRLKVKQYLAHSIELLKESGVEAETSTLFGKNIAKSTLELAKVKSGDLIVMMAESEPSAGLFMGSNAQQVVNRSEIPVLTLHTKDVGITYAGY